MTDERRDTLLGFTYEGAIDVVTPDGIGAVKNIQFTSTIPKDCSQHELDSLVDKCRLAVTRQRVFASIDKLEIDLRNTEANLDLAHRTISAEDKRFAERAENHDGRAARGLSSGEQKDRQTNLKNLENGCIIRDAIVAKLLALRALVGQDFAGGPTQDDTQASNGESARWADNGGAALS